MKEPSNWVREYCRYLPKNGDVLDLACGSGRHSGFLSNLGHAITAVDIDTDAIRAANLPNVRMIQADLEENEWPFEDARFSGVVVTNYLWREHFPALEKSLKSGGVLIFDTFMIGNEKYGRPSNPKFLLKSQELKTEFSEMELLAFQEGYQSKPSPAVRQSIVVRKR